MSSNKPSESPFLLKITDLKMHFPVKEGIFLRANSFNKAVDGVSLEIKPGETLGLVGESGCGKSTLGKCIARLNEPTSGSIEFDGKNITKLKSKALMPFRQDIQMIFQDPMESLNSRHTIGEILEEPYIVQKIGNKSERAKRIRELLDIVGLPARSVTRYPFEFSGGQRQRIGIARSIALSPKLLICDEPVSALDVSIQSQILNLLVDLQKEFNLAYLFIAHDLAVVKHISDRIAIMYLGKIVEKNSGEAIYRKPLHPYTKSLISAVPIPDPHKKIKRETIIGDVPSPIDPPSGCRFHPRCPKAIKKCQVESPKRRIHSEHEVSCHLENFD